MTRAPSALWRREDFPDLEGPDALDRFFRQLNAFAKGTEAFAQGLIDGVGFKALTLTAASLPLKFVSPVRAPRSVTIAQALDVSGNDPVPVSLANPAWRSSGADVVISGLGSLGSSRFLVTFRVEA